MNVDNLECVSPYSCYINLTSKCNLKCKHCFGDYGVIQKSELSLNQWKKVVDDICASKVFFINISGGEPTQSPHFKEFINYLSKKGVHFILTTNGVFSSDVRKFILNNREYLIGVKISLDGPDAKSHGFIRRDVFGKYNPLLFKTTLKNIFYFKKENIPITIATVLHTENIKKIKKLAKLVRKINPVSWFISPIVPVGRGFTNKEIAQHYDFFDVKFWNNVQEEGRKNKLNTRLIDLPVNIKKEGLSAYECAGALNFCEIHSDGTVSPCSLSRVCIPEDKIKFDNIKDKSLLEIWNGASFEKFRGFMNIGCEDCKMLSKCNKCVAQSFRYFDNGLSPTPYCIKQGKKTGLKNYEKYKKRLESKFKLTL